MFIYIWIRQRRSQDFSSGDTLGGRPRRIAKIWKNYSENWKCIISEYCSNGHGEFSKIWKKFIQKIENVLFWSIVQKIKTNVKFSRVWTKNKLLRHFWENFVIFWWKFSRKIAFLNIIGKVVAKNRAFGNNIIFLQQFFQFRGERSLCSPQAAPM